MSASLLQEEIDYLAFLEGRMRDPHLEIPASVFGKKPTELMEKGLVHAIATELGPVYHITLSGLRLIREWREAIPERFDREDVL